MGVTNLRTSMPLPSMIFTIRTTRISEEPKRLEAILNKLTTFLVNKKRPKLKDHDAIHLILLADTLWYDYTKDWEDKLPVALDRFLGGFADSKLQKSSDSPDEFWIRYGQWTRVNSDRGERIAYRNIFYTQKMLEYMAPLSLKDSTRTFGDLEREVLYFRSDKRCLQCGMEVAWPDAEIHHVVPHSAGGKTDFGNAALVHKWCHPKTESETKEFADKIHSFQTKKKEALHENAGKSALGYLWVRDRKGLFLPNQTEIRMTHKGNDFNAEISDGKFIWDGNPVTPGQFANLAANGSRNAWEYLYIKMPDDQKWTAIACCCKTARPALRNSWAKAFS
jgi:hypothetical protein